MEVTDFISRYKNKFLNINIVIIIVALIIANNIYKRQTNIIGSLKQNKDAEIKKNEILGSIAQLEKKINAYKDFLNINKGDKSLIMSTINDIAKDSDVKIVSFRPESEIDYYAYVKYPIFLVINAKDYNQIGRFMSKIENSSYVYMVDNLNIRPNSQEEKKDGTENFTIELILSTIWFKG